MKGIGTVRIAKCPDYFPGKTSYIGLALVQPDGELVPLRKPDGHDLLEKVMYLKGVLRDMGFKVEEEHFDYANSSEGKEWVGLK